MKTATRLLLGIVSTLLLTAGFARAAEQFDPVAPSAQSMASVSLMDETSPLPCMSCDDENPD